MRGADLLVKTLHQAGVEVIFTLSGNQIMPVFDACLDAGIRLIHVRHEGAATYMAEAYAQLTGKLGVALITAAPGFASGVGPLYMSGMSETPILLMSGDSPVGQDGMGAFQELDQVAVSGPLTKFSARPKTPAEMGPVAAEAIRTALSGRPGPVHLALAFDALEGDTDNAPVPSAADLAPDVADPSADAVASVLDAVAAAQRPVILTGPRLNPTRAQGGLAKLADALDAPVVPMESPRGLKDPSLGDIAEVLPKADLVVSLGKNMDFTTGFGKSFPADCKFMMIDPDQAILDRAGRAMGDRVALSHRADAPAALAALTAKGPGGNARTDWREEVAAAAAKRARAADPGQTPIHPSVLADSINRFLEGADDPIAIIDGGESGQWAQAGINVPTRIINGPGGSIGGCLCYAVAVKVARPDATVVVVMGDGTAGFHFAEFETANRYGADFTAVIAHDARWNAEYQIQLREYGAQRTYECELDETRYDLAAAGFGCHGEYVTDPKELDAALKRADDSGKAACLVAMIDGLPAPAGSAH
ncbi:MAG: thiamine pyrophosphate-binding protein [Rhodospirillaceae bacterium]|nr:thiamine pyrophosphate-binding protein [Rhodospirillaceae bacterium]